MGRKFPQISFSPFRPFASKPSRVNKWNWFRTENGAKSWLMNVSTRAPRHVYEIDIQLSRTESCQLRRVFSSILNWINIRSSRAKSFKVLSRRNQLKYARKLINLREKPRWVFFRDNSRNFSSSNSREALFKFIAIVVLNYIFREFSTTQKGKTFSLREVIKFPRLHSLDLTRK